MGETDTTPSSVQNFWCDFWAPLTLPCSRSSPNTGPQFPLRMARRLGREDRGMRHQGRSELFPGSHLQVSERVPLPTPSRQPE